MEQQLIDYLSNLKGKEFIKKIRMLDGQHLHIVYYSSYEDYVEHNEGTLISENEYKYYFNTGDQEDKLLVGEPVRLLREFKNIEEITFETKSNTFT